MHYMSAVALQEEELREATGSPGRSRRVDDIRHGIERLFASPLIYSLIDTATPMRNVSGGLIRRASEGRAR